MEMTAELYRQLSRIAFAAARRLGKVTVDDGEDLTQSVLLKLWNCRDRIRSHESLPALAYRAATTSWLNSCRSQSNYTARLTRYRDTVLLNGESAVETDCEESAVLWNCVAQLDARIAEAIRRRFCDGQSYAMIGFALGVSKCGAHKLVKRGLSQLKDILTHSNVAYADCTECVAPGCQKRRCKESRRQPLAIVPEAGIQTASGVMQAARSNKERGQSCPA